MLNLNIALAEAANNLACDTAKDNNKLKISTMSNDTKKEVLEEKSRVLKQSCRMAKEFSDEKQAQGKLSSIEKIADEIEELHNF